MEREPRLPLHEATRTLLAGCACPRCEVALAALADDALRDDALGDADDTAHTGALTRALAAGLRANTARLAQFERTLDAAVAALHASDAQRLTAGGDAPVAEQVVEELRARLARLEAQPVAGGPAARPVEKTLGGVSMMAGEPGPGAEFRALEALAGRLRDPQAQLAVATEMIRLQQRGE